MHKVGILKHFELLTAKRRVNAASFIKDMNSFSFETQTVCLPENKKSILD